MSYLGLCPECGCNIGTLSFECKVHAEFWGWIIDEYAAFLIAREASAGNAD